MWVDDEDLDMSERRADVFADLDSDPRSEPPTMGGERETLIGFLRWQRETLELKCSDLGAEQLANRSVEPSSMSLLGLLRHMADVERGWFRWFMAGEDISDRFSSGDDPDGDFDGAVADPASVEEAWEAWRAEVAWAEGFVTDHPDLDLPGKRKDQWRGEMSLRWVLVHMIEEYARHNGHADLLRERIDGRLGQ
jgi:uncharacterized damage-inducible protein DinB